MLRVPLIVSHYLYKNVLAKCKIELSFLIFKKQPCVNPNDQSIDVCCRDPNYVDPWPNMNGGNKNMNNGGNGNGNISPRRNQQNGNGNLGVQPARNQQNNGNGM